MEPRLSRRERNATTEVMGGIRLRVRIGSATEANRSGEPREYGA
jgi:hypothetical protein